MRIILFRHKTTLANKSFSSESSGFSLGLEKSEDVSLSIGALHVPEDLTGTFADELNFDLGALTLSAGAAQDLDDEPT